MSDLVKACWLLLGGLAWAPSASASAPVDEQAEAKALVQKTVSDVLVYLKDRELAPKARREGVTKIIEEVADLELLAKLALGKTHWGAIDAAQRESFTALFSETIQLSLFEKLELFTDEVVEVGEAEQVRTSGSPKFKVKTWIIAKGERTELALLITRRDDVLKVYDMEIEGVSIRKSYGSQYADFLRQRSFAELLKEMRAKVDEARERLAEKDAAGGRGE